MSRTSIFLQNNTSTSVAINSVDGKINIETTTVPPGQTMVVASIGDPGTGETATTGQIWIDCANALVRVEIRKPKKEDAECIGSQTYGYTLTTSNDYPEHGSIYSRSVTLHIS